MCEDANEIEAVDLLLAPLRPDYQGDASALAGLESLFAPAHALVQELHRRLGFPPGWQWFHHVP